VKENAYNRLVSLARRSVAARAFALVLISAVLLAICCVVSIVFSIRGGISAAFVSMSGCLVAGLLSTAVCGFSRLDGKPLVQLGFGMAIRMICLLGLVLIVHFRVPELVDSGFIFFLFVFYVADLSIETAMLVGNVSVVNKVAG
jgi:hypothetical protein